MTLSELAAWGFDASEPADGGYLRPRCYSCAALVISGHPTHELGCSNAKHECHGCNEIIPARQRYCENCQ